MRRGGETVRCPDHKNLPLWSCAKCCDLYTLQPPKVRRTQLNMRDLFFLFVGSALMLVTIALLSATGVV